MKDIKDRKIVHREYFVEKGLPIDDLKYDTIKDAVNEIDKSGSNNMFNRVKSVRQTKKQRLANLPDLLHPDLLSCDRVSIEKYNS